MNLRAPARRITVAGLTAFALVLAGCSQSTSHKASKSSSQPILIGTTLALTGALAPTATIHKIAGEQFVKVLNEHGGLLGRQVKWEVLDDQSSPATSASEYEQLISQKKVDLLIGPYGTANITASMQVAQRHNMVFPHDSGTLVYAYNYKWQFPLYASGIDASKTGADLVFNTYKTLANPPKSVAFVVSKFAATTYLADGHGNTPGAVSEAEAQGLKVVLNVQYNVGNTDWGPIAERVKSADPDLLYMESTGAEGPQLIAAMQRIGYHPRNQFFQFPAPGPMLAAGTAAENATTVTLFEPNAYYSSNPGAKDLVNLFPPAAEAAGIKYTVPDYQSALAWAEWQTLVAGVEGCQCLDQAKIADYLLSHSVPTVLGNIRFDPKQNNYYGDLTAIKQVQNGKWVVVYPKTKADPGVEIK